MREPETTGRESSHDQVPAVVHSFRYVLAAGSVGAGAVPHRVALAGAVPDCGDCRGGRAGTGERDHLSAGAAATDDLTDTNSCGAALRAKARTYSVALWPVFPSYLITRLRLSLAGRVEFVRRPGGCFTPRGGAARVVAN